MSIVLKNGKIVDPKSIWVAGIDMNDYPKFCDAYAEEAAEFDGLLLSDEELDELTENYSNLINELAHEQIH
jgi:hypothetical protein